MSEKKHTWLVAGQVITLDASGHERFWNLNVVVYTDEQKVTSKDIGRAQQGMQMRYMTQRVQTPGTRIIDCFVMSISHLGHMTAEEFVNHAEAASPAADPAQKSLELA